MKRILCISFAITLLIALTACSYIQEHSIITQTITSVSATEGGNAALKYLAETYDMNFRLYGPDGADLYVFYIYPEFAERECYILMPANTDDVAENHYDLYWEIKDNQLIVSGSWQETFLLDISRETATSTTTGIVYTICETDR